MSSLLEQAIIDAKTLKETARRNAEAALLEKYSSKIKQSIEMLLEQDEPAADPLAAAAPTPDLGLGLDASEPSEAAKKTVDKIPPAYLGENNMEEIDLDLDSLVEKVDAMKKELHIVDQPSAVSEPSVAPQPTTRIATDTLAEQQQEEEESLEESFELDDSLKEEIQLDMENVVPGGVQGNHIEVKRQMNIAKALAAQLEDLKEHLTVKDAEIESLQEELNLTKEQLTESKVSLTEIKAKLKKSVSVNVQLKESFEQFSQKLNEVNLINARLLYSNKALRNASLNERQRDQIAEAISNAATVDEAKTVYETLQKTMQTVVEKRTVPQSLSEALSKAPSPFLPRTSNTVDPSTDRWRILAGIKK
jgi:hypothetical protein